MAIAVVAIAAVLLVPGGPLRGPSPRSADTGVGTPLPVANGTIVVAPAYQPGAGVSLTGPLAAHAPLDVAVALAPTDPAGLEAATVWEYTPGSPQYHHYLSATDIADRYGPTASEYAAAQGYFTSFGLAIEPSPDRTFLLVQGPAAAVGAAFHTTFDAYRGPAGAFYNHPTPATLPAIVPWLGAYGLGSDSFAVPQVSAAPAAIGPAVAAPAASCGSGAPFAPCAIEAAYNASTDVAGGENGSGFRLAVVDAYDGQENQTQLETDVGAFTAHFGLAHGTVDYLYPVPTTRDLNSTATGWATEEALDVEWSRAIAPAATIEMTLAPDAGAGLYGSVDWLIAHQAADVISLSWGEPDTGVYNAYLSPCSSACNATSDGSYAVLHPALLDAAAEGITVLAASGDCGSADGTNGVATSYPASDPSVLGVGGTDLSLANGTYGSETAWSGNATGSSSPGCSNQGGSGGGYSPFPRPWWQRATGLPNTPAVRGVPDVAIDAGTEITIVEDTYLLPVGGTSASTVIWAGLLTDADSGRHLALGFVDPQLYQIFDQASSSGAFHDVTSGSNGYKAGTGWDPVTGLGSPNFGRLAPLLTAATAPFSPIAVTLGAGPRFGSAPLRVTFTVTGSGGQTPYALVDVSFGDGNASLAPSLQTSHLYPHAGVYVALATIFDAASNSSVSAPVAIVVGGGNALKVTLNATPGSPTVDSPVTFATTVTGGVGPYRFYYAFGDGSYLANTTEASAVHAYPLVGSYCATVIAWDSAQPVDAGASSRVSVPVGGASATTCGNGRTLSATAYTTTPIGDLPGDLNLSLAIAGGTPPYSVQWVTNDPYVNACDCGIFRVAGAHHLTAYVNDSVDQETTAALNVTLYPALVGTFTHGALAGVAPFTVQLHASATGGDAPNANDTTWSFADASGGSGITGASASYTYETPGEYLVIGRLADAAGGVTSVACLVDVLAAAGTPGLTAVVTPAQDAPAGTLVTLAANVTNATQPYTYYWNLGDDDDSAFGATVTQSFGSTACPCSAGFPLIVGLSATPRQGTALTAGLDLPDGVVGRGTAVAFSDSVGWAGSRAPLNVAANATVSGMPGLGVNWTFGDGGTAAGPVVTHQFRAAGNFTINETITDALGDVLLRSHAITVLPAAPSPPQISVVVAPRAGAAPLFVEFTTTVTGGGGPPYSVVWDFGDGRTGIGTSLVEEYRAPGWYNATATVTDGLNATNTTTVGLVAYARTAVTLVASLSATELDPNESFAATIDAVPQCSNLSAPGCGPAAFPVDLTIWPAVGGPITLVAVAVPGPTGGIYAPLAAPLVPGSYWLNATVDVANFSGTVEVPFTVMALPSTATQPFAATPLEILGGSVVLAAVVGVVAGRRRRGPAGEPVSP